MSARLLLCSGTAKILIKSTRRAPATASQVYHCRFASQTPHSLVKPPRYGQPTSQTHLHLVKPGEITPGITLEEYRDRRKRLMESLPDDAVVVCQAGFVKYASGEIFYKFRQDSDFWYLTGFQEPESALILEKMPSTHPGYKSTLFLRPKDPHQELWNGSRSGVDDGATLFGVDQALPNTLFLSYLKSAISRPCTIYAPDPLPTVSKGDLTSSRRRRPWSSYLSSSLSSTKVAKDETFETIISHAYKYSETSIRSLAPTVFRLRSVKSEAEQAVMLRAGQLSGTAHAKTMRFTEPGQSEAHLQAHFEYICALGGSERPAYVPVVASGANALIIHYTENDQIVNTGELVLMDAGCELHGYASDITRTWPVSGKFTEPQRDLYEAVLATLKACTLLCTENNQLTLYDIHRKSCEVLTSELNQIGFRGLTSRVMDRLYPHFVSHPIGIDLHESSFERAKNLVSGMVVTIEPGIYVPPDPTFPKHFHNVGIRLEDDILVGKDHNVRLTANAPLEIADVEGTCQGLLGVGPY